MGKNEMTKSALKTIVEQKLILPKKVVEEIIFIVQKQEKDRIIKNIDERTEEWKESIKVIYSEPKLIDKLTIYVVNFADDLKRSLEEKE